MLFWLVDDKSLEACSRARLFWLVDDKTFVVCSRARLWWLARGQDFEDDSVTDSELLLIFRSGLGFISHLSCLRT